MKVRRKNDGRVVSVTQKGDTTYTDDRTLRLYDKEELDFDCPHTKFCDVDDIIFSDYTDTYASGLTPVKPKNYRIRIRKDTKK